MNVVNPIKNEELLREIQEDLAAEKSRHGRRMFLLFEVGIHTGLRISDLVRLKVQNVCGPDIETVEQKTGKRTVIPLDATIRVILQDRLRGMDGGDWLFPSRTHRPDGSPKHISTRSAYEDMQLIKRRFNVPGPVGCHTMRKTFGYWHHKNNDNIELLRQWFNHSSVEVTRRYIGMDVEEKRKSVVAHNPGSFRYEPAAPVNRGRPRGESVPLEIENLDRARQGQALARARQRKKGAKR